MNFSPARPVWAGRDVGEITCISRMFGRDLAVAAVPAIAATAGEYSSDEILVQRIAAGDKLAMQVLFARHRTNVYRWLFRFEAAEGSKGENGLESYYGPPMAALLFRFQRRDHSRFHGSVIAALLFISAVSSCHSGTVPSPAD